MKYCQTCGKAVEDNNIVCPDAHCRGHLSSTPREENALSEQQFDAVTRNVWRRIWKKHLLFIFGEFSLFMVIGLVGLLDIYREASSKVGQLVVARIEREFQSERIRATVSEVASSQAKETINSQILPEVSKFEDQVGKELSQVKTLRQMQLQR